MITGVSGVNSRKIYKNIIKNNEKYPVKLSGKVNAFKARVGYY